MFLYIIFKFKSLLLRMCVIAVKEREGFNSETHKEAVYKDN